ncbi:MAG: sugar transferase [Hyphomicrobiales bacterium]
MTGASGFVGQQLVPRLASRGADLLLVGRNPKALARLFTGHDVCGYDELKLRARNADMLVHLAVRNSEQMGSADDFQSTNVDFLKQVLSLASDAGIRHLVHMSSLQALDGRNQSLYAQSKREAEGVLSGFPDITTSTIYLAAVYGDRFSGKLAILNSLPSLLVRWTFPVMAAFKPTVHIERLAAHIMQGGRGGILTDGQHKNWVYRTARVVIDLSFVVTVLLLLSWLLVAVWVSVRLTSPGPGLLIQTRVGQTGRLFRLYKFRTMLKDTENLGTHEVSSSAVTSVGTFLRRTKIDELPQALNILKGDLSLIGPRPCLPIQEQLIKERNSLNVLQSRPGITGLSQVEGIDMRDPGRLARRDADYAALQCISLDIRILLRTATGGGQGDSLADARTDISP